MEGTTGTVVAGDAPAVSFPDEELILVDGEDQVIGHRDKLAAHAGLGVRHRAFSVFLFDESGRLLVHRRSAHKPLWPGYWTNSCCSHPRRGESLDDSVKRRLQEELGCVPRSLRHVCHFEYRASFGAVGSEHELCHIYLARHASADQLVVHPLEIDELAWLDEAHLEGMMRTRGADLTPWFKLEWVLLRKQHGGLLQEFLAPDRGEDIRQAL